MNNLAAQLRRWPWLPPIAVAAIGTWICRYSVNADGISYLDLASAARRTGFHGLVNDYWSPAFPSVLAITVESLGLSPRWEMVATHATQFLILLAAFAAFRFFFVSLARSSDGDVTFPETFTWWLCAWSTIGLVGVRTVSPDLLLCAISFVAFGVAVMVTRKPTPVASAGLGAILALAYLTKAVFFPIALVVLATIAVTARPRRAATVGTLIAAGVFSAVVAPWVRAISRHLGQPTIGTTGRLNYLWFVNGETAAPVQTFPVNWALPIYATTRVLDSPPVYALPRIPHATFSPWLDPAPLYASAVPRFSATQQLRALQESVPVVVEMLAPILGLYLAALAIGGPGLSLGRAARPVLAGCAIAIVLYAFVHVETRYIAPFAAPLCLVVLGAQRPSVRLDSLFRIATIVFVGVTLWTIGSEGLFAEHHNRPWIVASALRDAGIGPGTEVATVGRGWGDDWGRLARARVVAAVPGDRINDFWEAPPDLRAKAVAALFSSGAQAVVADYVPADAERTALCEGWKAVAPPSVYVFTRSSGPASRAECASPAAR